MSGNPRAVQNRINPLSKTRCVRVVSIWNRLDDDIGRILNGKFRVKKNKEKNFIRDQLWRVSYRFVRFNVITERTLRYFDNITNVRKYYIGALPAPINNIFIISCVSKNIYGKIITSTVIMS